MSEKENKYWVKPSWWEILIYVIWFAVFSSFAGDKILKLSLVYLVVYLLGFGSLFYGIQQLRRHKLRNLTSEKHKLCNKVAWRAIIISGFILLIIIIDFFRFG